MNGIAAYQNNAVMTQSRGQIVVMLYDGAIKFLRCMNQEMQRGNHEEKARYMAKALDIIEELNCSLDMAVGGEIAQNLRRLYLFMAKEVCTANVRKDSSKIEHVIRLLTELNQGWKAIAS